MEKYGRNLAVMQLMKAMGKAAERLRRSTRERLKRAAFDIFYYSGFYFLFSAMTKDSNSIFIFAYHKIQGQTEGGLVSSLAVSAEVLENQICFFKQNFEVITMSEACDLMKKKSPLTQNYAVLTFDDGYRNNYEAGLPLFLSQAVKPIVYMTTGYINSSDCIWHDKVEKIVQLTNTDHLNHEPLGIKARIRNERDRSDLAYNLMQRLKKLPEGEASAQIEILAEKLEVELTDCREQMLGRGQLEEMKGTGIELGSHTVSHRILSSDAAEVAEYELMQSKKEIEAITGAPAIHFAYPDGKTVSLDPNIEGIVRKQYGSAVTTDFGINVPGCDLYRLKRIGIIHEMDMPYLKGKILLAKLSNHKRKGTSLLNEDK